MAAVALPAASNGGLTSPTSGAKALESPKRTSPAWLQAGCLSSFPASGSVPDASSLDLRRPRNLGPLSAPLPNGLQAFPSPGARASEPPSLSPRPDSNTCHSSSSSATASPTSVRPILRSANSLRRSTWHSTSDDNGDEPWSSDNPTSNTQILVLPDATAPAKQLETAAMPARMGPAANKTQSPRQPVPPGPSSILGIAPYGTNCQPGALPAVPPALPTVQPRSEADGHGTRNLDAEQGSSALRTMIKQASGALRSSSIQRRASATDPESMGRTVNNTVGRSSSLMRRSTVDGEVNDVFLSNTSTAPPSSSTTKPAEAVEPVPEELDPLPITAYTKVVRRQASMSVKPDATTAPAPPQESLDPLPMVAYLPPATVQCEASQRALLNMTLRSSFRSPEQQQSPLAQTTSPAQPATGAAAAAAATNGPSGGGSPPSVSPSRVSPTSQEREVATQQQPLSSTTMRGPIAGQSIPVPCAQYPRYPSPNGGGYQGQGQGAGMQMYSGSPTGMASGYMMSPQAYPPMGWPGVDLAAMLQRQYSLGSQQQQQQQHMMYQPPQGMNPQGMMLPYGAPGMQYNMNNANQGYPAGLNCSQQYSAAAAMPTGWHGSAPQNGHQAVRSFSGGVSALDDAATQAALRATGPTTYAVFEAGKRSGIQRQRTMDVPNTPSAHGPMRSAEQFW